MKRETVKRVLALLICVWMTVSLLPAVAMAEEVTEDVIDDSTIEAYTSYENGEDAGVSGVSVTDEKPNTDIKVIPSDANALILMDTGAQSPQGVPGQVVKIVLPLAVNKEYLPSEKYMLRNINIYPDVPTDASVSNWPFELIYASDVQHLKDMSYNSTAEAWFEFKISEFASKGRYAVPFKINATVWREDAVNGTTITEDVTFKVSAYVTVTDNGNMSGVTTSFGSLQVAGTNAGGSYTVPTGTPNQTISMRIPVINVGGTLTSVTVYPVVSAALDEFPFVIDSTNLGKYFDYWASGEVKYLDYKGAELAHLFRLEIFHLTEGRHAVGVVAVVHALQADLHHAAPCRTAPGHKRGVHEIIERSQAGRRQRELQRDIVTVLQKIQNTHIFAGLPLSVCCRTVTVQLTGSTGAAGCTVALLSVHSGAQRDGVIIVFTALGPIRATGMVIQDNALQKTGILRILRVAGRQLELQCAAGRDLDLGE